MEHRAPPPGDAAPAPGPLRTGFTTGACAAAAARAAAHLLATGERLDRVTITLPNGLPATFPVAAAELRDGAARATVVKDAGDDPDVTHGAEIVAEVAWAGAPGVAVQGGPGVATVTRPGLGLEVGAPAINPAPRASIVEMVSLEIAALARGASVTIGVPGGEELARRTLNPRLGLTGGISILGTSGIVRPFSTAAWEASVVQAIDVARAAGVEHLVFTTGGRSERWAMRLLPALPELAFVQAGDFVGTALRHAARTGARRATLAAMVGKLTKVASGHLQTHASQGEVDVALLAELARDAGATPALVAQVAAANTARHALELARRAGLAALPPLLCRCAAERLAQAAPSLLPTALLLGFDGALLAAHPPLPESA